MKMCESCGESEVIWLDHTSDEPEPEEQSLCLDCYDNYPWHGRCQMCGAWGWINADDKCWGCNQTDTGKHNETEFGKFCNQLFVAATGDFSGAVELWKSSNYTDVDELWREGTNCDLTDNAASGWRIAMAFCLVAHEAKQGEI